MQSPPWQTQPQAPPSACLLPEGIEPFVTDRRHFDRVFSHPPRGRAVGLLGTSFEGLSAIYRVPGGADVLFSICSELNAGLGGDTLIDMLGAARLLGLCKEGGGCRPLAICDALTRLAGRTAMTQIKGDSAAYFTSLADGAALRATPRGLPSPGSLPSALPSSAAADVVAKIRADDATEATAVSAALAASGGAPPPSDAPPTSPPPASVNVPLQLGCGYAGGAEFLAHTVRLCLELYPSGALCGNDVRNGFNCCSRDAIFAGLLRLRDSPFASLIPALRPHYGMLVKAALL